MESLGTVYSSDWYRDEYMSEGRIKEGQICIWSESWNEARTDLFVVDGFPIDVCKEWMIIDFTSSRMKEIISRVMNKDIFLLVHSPID